jgi:MFS family permease
VLPSDGQGGAMPASAPSPPATVSRARTLRRRDVRLLLAGQATSELGSQVGSIALPLVAVLGLGASPLQIGVLTAAGTISFAVLALPAGVGVDRMARRPVLVGADLARGLAPLGGLAGERLGVHATLCCAGLAWP